jgi:hypothetical protein
MPNLVGIHDPTAAEDELARDLSRMMTAVDLPAFRFTRRTIVSAPIACGNVLTGIERNLSQPVKNDARGVWLMLDGEILNADELRGDLAQRGFPAAAEDDDAKVALDMYLAYGASFFERLNGTWNLVLNDAAERYTLLISDRIGSRLLYYAEEGSRFVFSSEAKAVIAGRKTPTRLGGVGLYQLLLGGAHVGERTWLEGVRVLDPGTIVRLDRDGRRRHRYWRFHFRDGAPSASESAYAEGFARRLRIATDRCMRRKKEHPIAITLSGGLDSRSVALSIDRARLPIPAITYGAPESPDVIYARQLAQVIGLEHHYIEDLWPGLVEESSRVLDELVGPSPSGKRGFYSSQLDRVAWRSEAMAAINGVASTIWHPLYRRYMRIMLNGACGDAMTGSHLTPNLLLGMKRKQLVADLMRRTLYSPRELVHKILAPEFAARGADELEPYFASTLDAIEGDDAMAIANVWDMENRQRRGTFSSFTIERYFCTCRSPYLDYELTELLADVPGRWRFQQRIYKRMLVEHFPEARHVPWAYTRGRITASPTYEFLREAYNFSKGRIMRVMPARRSKQAHWLFRDELSLFREDRDLALLVDQFTRAPYFPADVFDANGIREVVEMFGRGEHASELAPLYAHLVGIAKCCELFFGRSEIAVPAAADPSRFGVAVD